MKLLGFTQLAVPWLAACLGVSVVAMAVDIIAFSTHYFAHDTARKQNRYARVHYEAVLEHTGYHPAHMPYTRPALITAVGVLCVVFNVAGAVMLYRRRQWNINSTGKSYSSFAPTFKVLGIDTILLLLTLATTIYAWWPAFDPITAHKVTATMAYGTHPVTWVWHHKNTIFDSLNWFCALYPFIPPEAATFDKTRSTCREGNALLDVLIALVLVQAGALALHAWSFFAVKKAQKKLDEKVAEDSDRD